MAVTIREMKLEYNFGMKIKNFVKCWSCLSLFPDFFLIFLLIFAQVSLVLWRINEFIVDLRIGIFLWISFYWIRLHL